jgi:hypothetical protein
MISIIILDQKIKIELQIKRYSKRISIVDCSLYLFNIFYCFGKPIIKLYTNTGHKFLPDGPDCRGRSLSRAGFEMLINDLEVEIGIDNNYILKMQKINEKREVLKNKEKKRREMAKHRYIEALLQKQHIDDNKKKTIHFLFFKDIK